MIPLASTVRLRPATATDAAAVAFAVRESMAEIRPFGPWCHEGYGESDAQAWIATTERGFRDGSGYEFLVVDGADGILGACGLNAVDAANRRANLGYWVRSPATGRGVATAAVRELVAFAFAHTELRRLEILCAVDNAASRRVAVKAGAIAEGVLRDRLWLHGRAHDAVLFSILHPGRSGAAAALGSERVLPGAPPPPSR